MKKQLTLIALIAAVFAGTAECKKSKKIWTITLAPGSAQVVNTKKRPSAPAGVTVTKISKKQYRITNNTAGSISLTGRKK